MIHFIHTEVRGGHDDRDGAFKVPLKRNECVTDEDKTGNMLKEY